MSKRDIMVFLFKWKYSLIGYLVFVVAAVTVFVYLMPQKYDATASVLIESNRAPAMRSDPVPGIDEFIVLNSEIAIIQSRTVLSSAADKVGVGGNDEPLNFVELFLQGMLQWMEELGLREPMTPREAMIKYLQDDLEVEPLPSSNVIVISLRGKNAKSTAALVNAVTEAYIGHHLKMFSSAGTAGVLRLQLDLVGRELDTKRKELHRYKQQTAVSALADTRHALARLQGELTLEISKVRNELADALIQFGANNTKVTLAREKLGNFQAELKETVKKLQTTEVQEGRVREMEFEITSIEKSYQEYQKRYDEGRLDNYSNPDVVNVRVIEYAEVPTRPKHSRIFYIALAVAGGALLSLAIAFIREYFDHRVTDPDIVEQLLGVPTLGSLEHA